MANLNPNFLFVDIFELTKLADRFFKSLAMTEDLHQSSLHVKGDWGSDK